MLNFSETIALAQFYVSWSDERLFYDPGAVILHRGKTWIASERVYYWDEPGVHPVSRWTELVW